MSVLDLSHIALSPAGFRDGLGERLLGFDRSGGATLELLRVRPELAAFEAALAERIERLAEFTDRRFATLRGVARDPATGRPLIVSEHVEGERLSEVLERASARQLVPDITVALHIVVCALQALTALDRACKTAHGALGLERVIVTPRGRLVFADHALAPVLAKLGFSHGMLWRELRLAMPAKPVPARFDARADIAQLAILLIAYTIGRPLLTDEHPGKLAALASEVREIARIRGGDDMADAVGNWLDCTLPTARRSAGFDDAAEARFELERALPKEPGLIGSRQDLHAFLDQVAAPDSGVIPIVEAEPAPEPQDLVAPPEPAAAIEVPIWSEPETVAPTPVPVEEIACPPPPELVPADAAATVAAVEPIVHETSAPAPFPIEVEGPPAGPTLTFNDEAVAEATASFAKAFEEAEAIEEEVQPAPAVTEQVIEPEPAPVAEEVQPALAVTEQVIEPEAARIEEDVEPALESATETSPPVASFDFAVPPPDAPSEVVSPIESAPQPLPRRRLISDVDLSLLPEWMVKPDAAAAIPQAPSSPAPPAARSTWLDMNEVPVREGTLTGPAGAEVAEPREETTEDWSASRARQIVEVAPRTRDLAPRPAEWLAPEPESEPEVAIEADVARPRARRFLGLAVAVLLVATAAAVGVRWLNTRSQPGTVVIETTPGGSEVVIDGQPSGTTPVTLTLEPGPHTLELRRRNRTRTFTLTVASGAEITQSLNWDAVVDTGALRVTSEPDAARVSIDGRPRGQTPLEVPDLAVGRHAVVVETEAGSVTNYVSITFNETATLHVPVYAGWLAIFSPVELTILERGRPIGTSSDERLMARAGRHELELVNEQLGYRSTETLDVKPGEVASLSLEPKGQVNLNAIPWAEVFIDGEKIGETPLANVPVTIGTREFVFRHPELGERRVTAVVTMKETTHVNVDLTKQ